MIDLKTLAMQENRHLIMESTGFTAQGGAELRRLAMRYLALRDSGIYFSNCNPLSLHGENLDAHADRLIQEMME